MPNSDTHTLSSTMHFCTNYNPSLSKQVRQLACLTLSGLIAMFPSLSLSPLLSHALSLTRPRLKKRKGGEVRCHINSYLRLHTPAHAAHSFFPAFSLYIFSLAMSCVNRKSLFPTQPITDDVILERHVACLTLCAFVQSAPYSTPDWLPECVVQLAKFSSHSPPHYHSPAAPLPPNLFSLLSPHSYSTR